VSARIFGEAGPLTLDGSMVARVGRGPLRSRLVQRATAVELHLSPCPTFTKRFGRRVKALGGRYSDCRGSSYKRFVTVPVAIPEGRVLVDVLVAAYGGPNTTAVLRGPSSGPGVVLKVDRRLGEAARLLEQGAEARLRASLDRGEAQEVTGADLEADEVRLRIKAREAKVARLEKLRAEVAALEEELNCGVGGCWGLATEPDPFGGADVCAPCAGVLQAKLDGFGEGAR